MNILNVNWYKIFYWLSVADAFKVVIGTIAIISAIITLASVIGYLSSIGSAAEYAGKDSDYGKEEYDSWQTWVKGWKRIMTIIIPICVISVTLWALAPTKKDAMLIIAGGSVGNFITTDSSSRALPADLTRYLHIRLNKELDDMGQKTKKELGIPMTKKETLISNVKELTKEQIVEYLQNDTTIK